MEMELEILAWRYIEGRYRLKKRVKQSARAIANYFKVNRSRWVVCNVKASKEYMNSVVVIFLPRLAQNE